MKKIRTIIAVLAVIVGVGVLSPIGAYAASPLAAECQGVTDSTICNTQNASGSALAHNIVNVLLFIIGAISVIMIIIGGLLYAVSAGDSSAVTRAKNTLLYAVVGLVVAFVAYAVVQFVFSKFGH